VLPLVGSMMTEPSPMRPRRSASASIGGRDRSLTLPPGLKNSTFATSRAVNPCLSSKRESARSGVRPISSVTAFYYMLAIIFSSDGHDI
jgi:hypothetical protein